MKPGEDPQPDAQTSGPPERFAENQFYHALSMQTRRRILAHLLACEQRTVEELVDVLCGWEVATSPMVDSTRAEQLRIELVHHHLPLLEEASLLRWDRASGEVTIEPLSRPVEQLIQQSIEAE